MERDILNDAIICESGKVEGGLEVLVMTICMYVYIHVYIYIYMHTYSHY